MSARQWQLVRRALFALALVFLVLVAAVLVLLAAGRARLNGTRTVHGLHGSISIERDALGTVTIAGRDRSDISYALGYVHAQDRFFEMDLMRRMPAGELAALVGRAALSMDLDHRRHRLRSVVRAAYAQLPAQEQRALQKYRDGVNAGLADLRVRPWEYLLLRATPQPWHTDDSMLMIAAMYLQLNEDGDNPRELRLAQMRSVLPAPLITFLLAPDPAWEAPLRGALSPLPVIPDASLFDVRASSSSTNGANIAAALASATQAQYPGSNSFAVSGALSSTGAALLANDMHLGLGVPNIWFRTRLRYPDPTAPQGQRDVNGVSLPGTPAMVVGSNGQIAWGFTNSYGDWLDWVRVLRDPSDPSRYKVPEGWAPIEHHAEHIQVKGQPDTLLDVAQTRWGPIMGSDADGTPLALAWTGAQVRGYNLDLLRMERSASASAALDLAAQLGMPVQNLLVADRAGHIGWTVAGNSIPLRGTADPLLPADWSRAGSGWHGWATAAQYPRITDPADGRLWTANNRTVDGADLALLGNGGHDIGARAQQIRDDLRARGSFTPGNLLDIQLDDRAAFLTRWQRLLQTTLADSTDPALQDLRKLSSTWRERAATDSVDYRLVRAFRTEVATAVLAPFVLQVKARHADFTWPSGGNTEAAVWMLVHSQPAHLLDPQYPNWHALLVASAKRVVATLGAQSGGLPARTWGERNRSGIHHPLAAALPSWLAHFIDMPDQPLAGDRDMPRVAAPGFGASQRLDVAPGDEAHGTLSMPGGQTGNPLSPYFGAGHADWVAGRATPLLPGKTIYRLQLEPAAP